MAISEAMGLMYHHTIAQIPTPSAGITTATDRINQDIIHLIILRQEVTSPIGTHRITVILGILIGQTPTPLHTPDRGIEVCGAGGKY